MSGFNTGYISTEGTELRTHTQQQHYVDSIGSKESEPVKKDLETPAAIVELDSPQTDHSADTYSHNRYEALAAYKGTSSLKYSETAPSDLTQTASSASDSEEEESTEEYGLPPLEDSPESQKEKEAARKKQASEGDTDMSKPKGKNGEPLTDEEVEQVEELKERDQEVRVHEQAHQSRAGQYGSAPSYDYQTGPDGNRYAVGGEVQIDTSEEDTPEKTIEKMETVRAAALAPQEPSSQDRKVAAEAQQKANEARRELSEQKNNGSDDESENGNKVNGDSQNVSSGTDNDNDAKDGESVQNLVEA